VSQSKSRFHQEAAFSRCGHYEAPMLGFRQAKLCWRLRQLTVSLARNSAVALFVYSCRNGAINKYVLRGLPNT
jgi:hypothetical protein